MAVREIGVGEKELCGLNGFPLCVSCVRSFV